MSHNITRVAGATADTVITENPRPGLVSIVPEQTMAGTLTIYQNIDDAVAADGSISANSGGVETDSVTIGNITITLDDTPADEDAMATTASPAALTTALLAALLAHSAYADEDWTVEQTGANELTITAKETGTAGNAIALAEVGSSFTKSAATLTSGTPGGTVVHVCAVGLTQAGKKFSNSAVQLVGGFAVVRSNTADEVAIVWAPGLV